MLKGFLYFAGFEFGHGVVLQVVGWYGYSVTDFMAVYLGQTLTFHCSFVQCLVAAHFAHLHLCAFVHLCKMGQKQRFSAHLHIYLKVCAFVQTMQGGFVRRIGFNDHVVSNWGMSEWL